MTQADKDNGVVVTYPHRAGQTFYPNPDRAKRGRYERSLSPSFRENRGTIVRSTTRYLPPDPLD
jgi:hypothetical protein